MTSPEVLATILDRAGQCPDRPAVKDLDRSLSYDELRLEAATLAVGLAEHGVVEGDRVCLLLPNSVDFVVCALACLWIGAIFVPLAVTDPPARLESIVADCAPALVVTPDSQDDGTPPPAGATSVSIARLRRGGTELPDLHPGPHRLAYAIYTSGTTGTPKGVVITTPGFAAAVSASADALGIDGQTRGLCVSPFHFDGSFGTLFPTLYAGGALIIRPREALLFPRTFFNAVKKEEITVTGFSPTYLRLLLTSPQIDQLAATALSVVALGGEACSVADVRALWEAAPQVQVFNRYGPTETTIAVTHVKLTPEMLASGPMPIGRPHPGVTFHIVDGAGRLVDSADRIGELYIGGSQLMEGYWGAPELTGEVLRTDLIAGETVYRTGDLVYRTETGDYVYVDRADRVIKRLGVRISLIELGEAMRGLEGVTAAACLAYDDRGQLGIAAFVVADGSASVLDLRRAAGALLPESMLPDRIEIVDALPLTPSSKLDERRLLAEVGLREVDAAPAY